MKLVLVLGALLLAAGCWGQSLVANGTMESGDEQVTGWTQTYFDLGKIEAFRDTTTFAEGDASLRLESVGGRGSGNVVTPISDGAGKTLRVSGAIKSKPGAAGLEDIQVVVFGQDPEGKLALWQNVCPREAAFSADWTRFEGKAVVPTETSPLLLMLFLRGEGQVWLDDIRVFDDSSVAPEDVVPLARGPGSPRLVSLGLAAPDTLAVTIESQRVVPASLTEYSPQPGDERKEIRNEEGRLNEVRLVRENKEIGWLIGEQRDWFVAREELEGDELQTPLADWTSSYLITSPDDADFTQPVKPTAVFRKSKPTDWQLPGGGFSKRHFLYLRLPKPLKQGKTYLVSFGGLNVAEGSARFTFDFATTPTEALHVNQIGYRPDDPAKQAFCSLWLGTGGPQPYEEGTPFHLVDAETGESLYTGQLTLAWPADKPELMAREANFNKTSVYKLDFSDFAQPGTYRVAVEGLGCSLPFEIGADVWKRAFLIQMKGLLNERSGIALGPPYTDFVKPVDFRMGYPEAQPIYHTTLVVMNPGDLSKDLAPASTGELVPEAWGGYHDAGDWNPRRVTHLRVTMAQLELLKLFPDYFRALDWPLPKETKAPAVIEEAVFELECFRRLQSPDGGVSWGIETPGDPLQSEVSWIQSMPAYVAASDLWSSYIYAAVAARASGLLKLTDPELAATYRESAVKAFDWAEADWASREGEGKLAELPWEVEDDRNLAAIALFELTGETRFHDVFLASTCLLAEQPNLYAWGDQVQKDAAFAYTLLPEGMGDNALKARAAKALELHARQYLDYQQGNAFELAAPDRWKPQFISFYSAPDAIELVRAHYLTGKAEYLEGALKACQFGAGCNPGNLCYTSGLGANPVRHPLHLDSRWTGQPAPDGLTVFGNVDFVQWNSEDMTWPIRSYLSRECTPSAWDWPVNEAYYDIFLYPIINEFVVDRWAPNVYVWGYLAARP